MINPKTILAEWVTALQALPNLVRALGDASNIQFYSENRVVFGKKTKNNIRSAILSMPTGSIMIVWNGTVPGRLGGAQVFKHKFSLYLRAPEVLNVGYEDLFTWIVEDIPANSALKMLHVAIDPACEPMDFELPSAQRNTVVVSDDGTTFEYFEVPVSLIESFNP
jgi:hypothetical protein